MARPRSFFHPDIPPTSKIGGRFRAFLNSVSNIARISADRGEGGGGIDVEPSSMITIASNWLRLEKRTCSSAGDMTSADSS